MDKRGGNNYEVWYRPSQNPNPRCRSLDYIRYSTKEVGLHARPSFLREPFRTVPRFVEQELSSEKNTETGAVGVKKPPFMSLLQRIDNAAGMSLKPKAMEAKEKLATVRKPSKKFRYTLQSEIMCAIFPLYSIACLSWILCLPFCRLQGSISNDGKDGRESFCRS
jgi:hypothetical protein